MRETENLSRHEQLRLDYLHTNYYYLNEHEKEEYLDLVQKLEELDYSLATHYRQLID